jgi:hypothetical protein
MSETFTVTTPVPGFNGDLGGLQFRDGKATADSDVDAAALAYARRHGYGVEPVKGSKTGPSAGSGGDVERPKGNASKAEWVAYAVAQGADEAAADAMTRDELADKYDGRPKPTDNKPDWVAYAVSQGADADEAEAMTKAELVDKYGKDA